MGCGSSTQPADDTKSAADAMLHMDIKTKNAMIDKLWTCYDKDGNETLDASECGSITVISHPHSNSDHCNCTEPASVHRFFTAFSYHSRAVPRECAVLRQADVLEGIIGVLRDRRDELLKWMSDDTTTSKAQAINEEFTRKEANLKMEIDLLKGDPAGAGEAWIMKVCPGGSVSEFMFDCFGLIYEMQATKQQFVDAFETYMREHFNKHGLQAKK